MRRSIISGESDTYTGKIVSFGDQTFGGVHKASPDAAALKFFQYIEILYLRHRMLPKDRIIGRPDNSDISGKLLSNICNKNHATSRRLLSQILLELFKRFTPILSCKSVSNYGAFGCKQRANRDVFYCRHRAVRNIIGYQYSIFTYGECKHSDHELQIPNCRVLPGGIFVSWRGSGSLAAKAIGPMVARDHWRRFCCRCKSDESASRTRRDNSSAI